MNYHFWVLNLVFFFLSLFKIHFSYFVLFLSPGSTVSFIFVCMVWIFDKHNIGSLWASSFQVFLYKKRIYSCEVSILCRECLLPAILAFSSRNFKHFVQNVYCSKDSHIRGWKNVGMYLLINPFTFFIQSWAVLAFSP